MNMKAELQTAFESHDDLFKSYLERLDIAVYAFLESYWETYGEGNDNILSFAEKVRLGKIELPT
jgi:hypothetical protein